MPAPRTWRIVRAVALVAVVMGCSLWAGVTWASPPAPIAVAGFAGTVRHALAEQRTRLAVELARPGGDTIEAHVRRWLERPVRVTFAGDVALTYQIAADLEARSQGKPGAAGLHRDYPFQHLAERLRGADLVVGNLECVMSKRGSLATDYKPLQCPAAGVEVLRRVGFGRVSVANNHAMDFGPVAFRDMLDTLRQRELPHFGAELFTQQPQSLAVHVVRQVRLGLLAFYGDSAPQTLLDLRRADPLVDVLAVFAHWGIEHQPEPMAEQRRLARAFIDEGADLVVGTHAHVLQPIEHYRGKLIAYGLGNFVFPGMGDTEAHRRGALLEVDLDRRGVRTHRLVPTRLDTSGVPHPVVTSEPVSSRITAP